MRHYYIIGRELETGKAAAPNFNPYLFGEGNSNMRA